VGISVFSGATFHAVALVRAVDSRIPRGATALVPQQKQTITFAGFNGIPSGAVAITGTLTVISGASYGGYVTIAPTIGAGQPPTSTNNFPVSDIRADGITVGLTGSGTADVVYWASTSAPALAFIMDISGYYANDTTGATYHPITPGRLVDSRFGIGGVSLLHGGVKQSFTVWGSLGVPSTAVAVTATATATSATYAGFITVGPSLVSPFPTSTVNFPVTNTRSVGVTLGLSGSGTLDVVYTPNVANPAYTVDFNFDLTGYYTYDATGYGFHAIAPARVLSSTVFNAQVKQTISVAGPNVVPAGATGVTGNITVISSTVAGYVSVMPTLPSGTPPISTVNLPVNDIRSNGVACGLAGADQFDIVFWAGSYHVNVLFDVTGYFQ
jgi:hypothetical protein